MWTTIPLLCLALSLPAVGHGAAIGIAPRQHDAGERNVVPPLRIMPVGASITHGMGSSDGNGYRKALHDGIIDHLGLAVNMVGSTPTPNHQGLADFQNEGWVGRTIAEVRELTAPSLSRWRPNLVLIHAGTNDATRRDVQPVGEAGRRMAALLDAVYERASEGVVVILSTLLPVDVARAAGGGLQIDAGVNRRVDSINDQYRELVSRQARQGRRILLADMARGDGPRLQEHFDDGVHPNDLGYSKMAQIWLDAVRLAVNRGMLAKAAPINGLPDNGDDNGGDDGPGLQVINLR